MKTKILPIVLCVLLVLLTACAAKDPDAAKMSEGDIWLRDIVAAPAQEVTVELVMKGGADIAATDIEFTYDPEQLEFVSFEALDAFAGTSESNKVKDGNVKLTMVTLKCPEQQTVVGHLKMKVKAEAGTDCAMGLKFLSCYDINVKSIERNITGGTLTVK